MASRDWDANSPLDLLVKIHKDLEKKIKKAPDAAKHKAKKDSIDKQINEKKLEYAQKQFDLEQMKLQLKVARDEFRYHLEEQKLEAKKKEEHFAVLNTAKGRLQSKFSGSKITNPEQKLEMVENEIRQLRIELQTGSHTNNGERIIIRNIAAKKEELEVIKGYIENNVGEYQAEYEATAKKFSGVMATWKDKVQKTDDAGKQREILRKATDQVKEEKESISKEIKDLAKEKKDLQNKYQSSVKEYEKVRRDHSEITVAIAMKKNRQLKKRESDSIRKEYNDKQNAEERKRKDKQKKQEEEEEKRRQATELKRKKAIEAYNAMQKKLKAKNTSTASRPTGGAKKAAVASSQKEDKNAANKEMCRSLIVLCESMVPTGRKKKKKQRLVYRADSFVKFNKVGVKIPKYAKDLDGTIKALEKRIASYDEEPEEVPVKEEATATEEEAGTKDEAEEVTEKEEPAEAEEVAENAI